MAAIVTDRLTLRAPERRDADAFAACLSDFDVTGMLARAPYPYDHSHALRFIEAAAACRAQGTGFVFTIENGGAAIGCIGIDHIVHDEAGGRAELGYWLGKPHWGKGYATEAAAAAVGHGFREMFLETILAGHFADNPASGRVLTKLAFEPVGRGRRRCLARDTDVDHIDMRLTRARWQDRQ